jgi:MFS family permease
MVAPFAGRLTDRFGVRVMNGAALALMALSFVLMSVSGASLLMLAIGVILLDAGEQASHISNQARIFALEATLRNRLNAVYMVAFFIGGAIGSLLAGIAWHYGGWLAVCAVGAGLAVIGMIAALLKGETPASSINAARHGVAAASCRRP